MAGEVVKVLNKGESDFRDGWDGQQYTIKPGQDAFVPYDAILNWLGNPAAIDYSESQRDRLSEYTRLRVRYGAYENDGAWEDNKPSLEVFTLDGKRITTVVDDPEGLDITPEIQTKRENMLLADRLALLEEELKQVRSQQAEEVRASEAERNAANVTGDRPSSARTEPSSQPAKPFGADRSGTKLEDEPKESNPREAGEGDVEEDGPTRVKVK